MDAFAQDPRTKRTQQSQKQLKEGWKVTDAFFKQTFAE
jgi:hypothetical protein